VRVGVPDDAAARAVDCFALREFNCPDCDVEEHVASGGDEADCAGVDASWFGFKGLDEFHCFYFGGSCY